MPPGPMDGVRVVEAAQMVAGPLAGMILAEQGADVIKVELPDGVGDRMRFLGSRRGEMGALYHGVNRGKRSVVIDAKHPDGLAVLRALVASADVFVQNFRPGAAERMGLGPEALLRDRPELVYVSVSGFGTSGPRSGEKVYDYVVQAVSGMAAQQAGPDRSPVLAKQIVVDKVTALTVAQAITAALYQRERTGRGQHVELTMLDTAVWFFWPDGMMDRALLGDGVTDAPTIGELAEIRATADGHVSLIAMGGRTWPHLVAAFQPGWADDPRFATPRSRELHRADLSAELDHLLAAMTTEECLRRLAAHDIPGAAVVPLDEVHEDPQVVHNATLVVTDSPTAGPIREPRPPVSFGGRERRVPGPAPALGEHTDQVLAELGYDTAAVASLRAVGALGPTT